MSFYFEIIFSNQIDISYKYVLEKFFQKLHSYFSQFNGSPIGVSFPKYVSDFRSGELGNVIRFHSNKENLEEFHKHEIFDLFSNFISKKQVNKIPSYVKYFKFSRIQSKSSISRMMRRSLKNGKISEDQALQVIENGKNKKLSRTIPFIKMKSSSNNNYFKLFIIKTETDSSKSGLFSSYGLSSETTVPFWPYEGDD